MKLIDADVLKDVLEKHFYMPDDQNGHLIKQWMKVAINNCITLLDEVPTIEVVRCKECSYSESDEFDWWYCHYHGNLWNKGDHFCSDGERIKS